MRYVLIMYISLIFVINTVHAILFRDIIISLYQKDCNTCYITCLHMRNCVMSTWTVMYIATYQMHSGYIHTHIQKI